MTDAELIAHLRRVPNWPTVVTLSADRLTQLSENNARLRSLMIEAKQRLSYDADIFHDQGCWNRGDACLAIVERIDAALTQGQKEWAER